MDYREARQYLEVHSSKGIVLGLDTMRGLMARLGDPQNQIQFIHVAGTNGKGSVAAFTSQILGEAGYAVGRYCSPSVFSYEEKIQTFSVKEKKWNNIPERQVADILTMIKEAADSMEAEGLSYPTVFEMETAMAFCYFFRMNCRYVVLETGMGGDLDATNIVSSVCCSVFVSISIDHSRILGNSLREIAGHKAGIIKPGCPVVTMEQKPEAQEIIESRCEKLGCTLQTARIQEAEIIQADMNGQTIRYGGFPPVHTALLGTFQKDNIAVVLEVIRCLRRQGMIISDMAVTDGIRHTVWPGRLERVREHPWIFLDGAHNPDAAEKLSKTLQKYFTNQKIVYIMGVLADKDYKTVLRYLGPQGKMFFTITPANPRALRADLLKKAVEETVPDVPVRAMNSIEEALTAARKEAGRQGIIVACGSLSFLGDLKLALEQEIEIQ